MMLDPVTGAAGGVAGARTVWLAALGLLLGAGGAVLARGLTGDDELEDDAIELHEVDLQDDDAAIDDEDDDFDQAQVLDDDELLDEELPAIDRHALLEQAMDDYVHGRYAEAIAAARVVERYDDPFERQRAVRIAGASSCFLRDRDAAALAWDKLSHPMDRAFLRYVCHRNDIEIP